jgi:hypothetical protein
VSARRRFLQKSVLLGTKKETDANSTPQDLLFRFFKRSGVSLPAAHRFKIYAETATHQQHQKKED